MALLVLLAITCLEADVPRLLRLHRVLVEAAVDAGLDAPYLIADLRLVLVDALMLLLQSLDRLREFLLVTSDSRVSPAWDYLAVRGVFLRLGLHVVAVHSLVPGDGGSLHLRGPPLLAMVWRHRRALLSAVVGQRLTRHQLLILPLVQFGPAPLRTRVWRADQRGRVGVPVAAVDDGIAALGLRRPFLRLHAHRSVLNNLLGQRPNNGRFIL